MQSNGKYAKLENELQDAILLAVRISLQGTVCLLDGCLGRCVEDGRERQLVVRMRQGAIIALGALEDYLGLARTVEPKRKR